MAVEIPLTRGKVTIVDDCDSHLADLNWYAGTNKSGVFYAGRAVWQDGKCKQVKMHRVILSAPEGLLVDHVNGDTLDNRRSNLRIATHAQNVMNRRRQKNCEAAFKGVSFNSRWQLKKPWFSRIKANGKHIWIGQFASAEEAARAYDAKARELFGEFAHLNFPATPGHSPEGKTL